MLEVLQVQRQLKMDLELYFFNQNFSLLTMHILKNSVFFRFFTKKRKNCKHGYHKDYCTKREQLNINRIFNISYSCFVLNICDIGQHETRAVQGEEGSNGTWHHNVSFWYGLSKKCFIFSKTLATFFSKLCVLGHKITTLFS